MFTVEKKDKTSSARTGILSTSHGTVETPAYVIVGTHAAVRCLPSEAFRATKTQIIIANTYHLWRTLGESLDSFEGVHARMGWNGPIMTDSGGFQVFSLGFSREHGVGKVASIFPDEEVGGERRTQENLVRITEDGVYFKENGREYFLDAKTSIAVQEKLGADIILAFDECTSPLHNHAYTRKALLRTHRWAEICLDAKTENNGQKLLGIIQGGAFEDLRKGSAAFIASLPFDGFAVGGSLGKSRREMAHVLDWTIPLLPDEKPRHLLGIGRIEDIFLGVERGVDMFDCVIPTREARHGAIWTHGGRVDIKKNRNATEIPLEEGCTCIACKEGITRKRLAELFKAKDPLAGEYATVHNISFFNTLMAEIRSAIDRGNFEEFKRRTLENLR